MAPTTTAKDPQSWLAAVRMVTMLSRFFVGWFRRFKRPGEHFPIAMEALEGLVRDVLFLVSTWYVPVRLLWSSRQGL